MDAPAKAVVIVGGGLSGLSAAVHLARLRIPAVLVDDAAELGSSAGTEYHDGFDLNLGAHRLYEAGAALRTLRELGVPIETARLGVNGGFAVRRGRKYTLPVGCCSLMTTGLLGARGKRETARLLASLPGMPMSSLQRVSIAEWMHTSLHDRDVIQLVLALVRYTTCTDDPQRQSASAALDQLRLSVVGPVLHVRGGWGRLAGILRETAATAGTAIVEKRRVASVDAAYGGAVSITLVDGTRVPARAVIVATGPQAAQRLLNGPAAFEVPMPVRVAALHLALRRLPDERAVFALGIDEPWCYSVDSADARMTSKHGAVVQLAKYLRGDVVGTPADERQLERALDQLQPGWRDLVVHRRFLPAAVVSHAVVAARGGGFAGRPTGLVPGLANVFLAGDWIGPVGQFADAAVSSGVAAARRVRQILLPRSESDGTH